MVKFAATSILLVILAGCVRHTPAFIIPAPPVVVIEDDPGPLVVGAIAKAMSNLAAAGRTNLTVPALYVLKIMPVDTINNGAPCFYGDGVVNPLDTASVPQSSYKEGKLCVQGYTNLHVFPPALFMVEGASPWHEFEHLIMYLNFPAEACPNSMNFKWGWVRHGGPCDIYETQPAN